MRVDREGPRVVLDGDLGKSKGCICIRTIVERPRQLMIIRPIRLNDFGARCYRTLEIESVHTAFNVVRTTRSSFEKAEAYKDRNQNALQPSRRYATAAAPQNGIGKPVLGARVDCQQRPSLKGSLDTMLRLPPHGVIANNPRHS